MRAFLPAIYLSIASLHAGGQPQVLEVEARFYRASVIQMTKVLGDAGAGDSTTLTSDQMKAALATIRQTNIESLGNLRSVGLSGNRLEMQSVREVRFPTEYTASKDEPGKLIPTTFESQNAGVTVSVDPVVAGGKISMTVSPTYAEFLGFVDSTKVHPDLDEKSLQELLKAPLDKGIAWAPVFESSTISMNVSLQSGQTVLLDSLELVTTLNSSPVARESAGRRQIFIFLTAREVPSK